MFRQVNTRHRPFRSANTNRERGAIAVFAAVLVTVAAAAAGAAVDFAMAYHFQTRLQQLADAAALAANTLKESERTEAKLDAIATTYFDADTASRALGDVSIERSDFDFAAGTYTFVLKGVFKTGMLSLAGIPSLTVRATAISQRKPGPLEIAIALDMTVSMLGTAGRTTKVKLDTDPLNAVPRVLTNIEVAKYAVKALVENLASTPGVTDENTKLGIAFFNVTAKLNSDTKVNDTVIDEGRPKTVERGLATRIDGNLPVGWNGCVGMRAQATDTETTLKNMKFVFSTDSSCKITRRIGSHDVDFTLPDAIPLSGLATNSSTIMDTLNKIIDRTPDVYTAGTYGPFSSSYVPAGIFAAFTLLRPNQPFDEFNATTNPSGPRTPKDLQAVGGTKNLIILADGWNNTGLDPNVSPNFQHKYATTATVADTQTKLCENIKKYGTSSFDGPPGSPGEGVNIFVVAFSIISTEAEIKSDLKKCASSPEMYFEANDHNELKQAFEDISLLIKRLRLTQ